MCILRVLLIFLIFVLLIGGLLWCAIQTFYRGEKTKAQVCIDFFKEEEGESNEK